MHYYFSFLFCLFWASQSLFAQSQPGGFTDQWANYLPGELGPISIVQDFTNVRNIEAAPAVGVHPRIYFGPSEIAGIKTNLTTTTSGQAALATIHAYTTLLHKGYSAGGYSHSANYAKDAFGNKQIDNAGKWDSHTIYYQLINNDPTALDAADNKRRYLLASVMALEAFECLMFAGTTDPDTGLDYDDRAADLGKAMAYWADLVDGDPLLNWNNYHHFGGIHMAYAYDLNYNSMTTAQQDAVRAGLAAIIPTIPRYGSDTEAYSTSSNWVGLNGFEILTNLAIEGETGYNATLNKDYMRAYYNFLTYGWYASGTPYEGLGKNYQFVTTLIAMAKRGYSLLGHPHVKTYGQQYLPAITQPYGHAFTGTDVWGGSGWDVSTGGYKFNASDVLGLKYVLPNDSKIDFVWRNYIEKWWKINSTGYVYQQIEPATSGYHNYLLTAGIFAEDYTAGDWTTQNSNTLGSLSFLGPERGLAILRSAYDPDAMMVHFHCRQDMGGHTHGDRNSFALSSLGRIWVRYTYGSHFQETQYHSCVLINDMGVKTSPLEGVKSRQPGKITNFYESNGAIAQVDGDATYAYSYEWDWTPRVPSEDHPNLGINGWTAVTKTWNDFRYQAGTETYHNIPFYDYAHWRYNNRLERIMQKDYNVMDRVYRNVSLIRCLRPYLLITDDLQKDNNVNNYKWLAQVASDLTVESTDINHVNTDYRSDVILTEPGGARKLLVRVLQNDGYTTGPAAILETLTPGINGNDPITRIKVEADVVTPNFKVMLYPFNAGESLPLTQWNTDKTELTVTIDGYQKVISFVESSGKTEVTLVSSTILPLEWLSVDAKAKDRNIEVSWATATEQETDYFVVERSKDAIQFSSIGPKVLAAGESLENQYYSIVDETAVRGITYYYRIKQVDLDGQFTYSSIVNAKLNLLGKEVTIFPNPVNHDLQLTMHWDENESVVLKIFNAQGQFIHSQYISLKLGQNHWSLNVSNWPTGVYWIEINGKETRSQQFIKE